LKFDLSFLAKFVVRKQAATAIAGLTALSTMWGGVAYADPVQDNVANFTELSRQAEQLLETVQAAQFDLDQKLQLQSAADTKHANDLVALDAARVQLAPRQATFDKLAAAIYAGGRADGTYAILTAASPQPCGRTYRRNSRKCALRSLCSRRATACSLPQSRRC